jgi:hypothetical protein
VLKVLIGWECGHETSGEILGDPRDIVRVSGHVVLADIGHCRIIRRHTQHTHTHTHTQWVYRSTPQCQKEIWKEGNVTLTEL